MKPLHLPILLPLLLLPLFASSQSNNPTIAVCNGKQYICATDTLVTLCVNIIVNPSYPNAGIISEFEIDWGDGSSQTIVPGGLNPPSQFHTYNVGSFFGSCDQYEIEYIIKLLTKHSDPTVEPANSAFFLYIRNPPQANFIIDPQIVCTNNPVTLTTIPCPPEGITYQFWDLGNGITGTGPSITDSFPLVDTALVQHCVGNVCDTVCSTRQIFVIDAAIANLEADSGVIVVDPVMFKACLDGGSVTVRLNASASLNVTSGYTWMIMGPSGWQWVLPAGTPTGDTSRVQFTIPGTYTVTVKVNNDCEQESEQSITIEVIEAQLLTLSHQNDTCQGFDYTPQPLLPDAVYSINGVVQSTFPVFLDTSSTPYLISALLQNECGDQMITDIFNVMPTEEISITSPANLTVCVGSAPISLQASRAGIWTASGGEITVAGPATQSQFNPTQAGIITVEVSAGVGVCKRSDSITIEVQDAPNVSLETPSTACNTADYSPMPLDPTVTYTINGNLVAYDSFPVTLDVSNTPYTIAASVTNTCGLVSDTVMLNIIAPVDVQIFAPNDTVVCSGTGPIPLFASDTIGTWEGPNIELTPQGYAFNPVQAGTATLIFERGFGDCYRSDTLMITVEPDNGVNAGTDQYLCNTQTSFTLPMGMPTGGDYAGFALLGNTIDLTQLTLDSAYIYTYTIPSLPDACNDDFFELTVSAPPDAGFTLSRDTSCIGQMVTVTPAASGNVNFTIDWGDSTSGPDLSHTYNTAGTFPISFTAFTTDPLGGILCSVNGTASIHIIQPIEADSIRFSMSPDSGCAPLTVIFENLSAAENGNYVWDFGNGMTFNGKQPGPITFEQGINDTTYTVRLIVDNGCDSLVITRTVTVFPQPRANFGITYLEPCSGGLLEASVLSTGNPLINTFYTSTGIQKTGSTTEPVFFQFYADSIPDTIGIWLVSENNCGIDSAYREVIVNPTDVVSVIGLPDTTAICAESMVSFINYATTGAPISWAVSNGNTYIGDTIQVVFTDPGAYEITLYAFGCGFDSMTVPVNVLPLPTLSVTHDLTKCPESPVAFQVNSNVPGIRLWYGDGDSTDQSISQKIYPAPGVYTPQATAVSTQGCKKNWSGSLTILTPPEAMATGEDSICVDAVASFSGNSDIANSSCIWDFGNGNVADECLAENIYETPGLFTAVLTVISPEGCRGQDTLPVYVRNRPDADFGFNILEPCTPAEVAFESQAIGATGLEWFFGDGTVGNQSAPIHFYNNGGQYTVQLIATNEGICSDTANQLVTIFQTPVFDFALDVQCTVPEGTDLTVNTEQANLVEVEGPNYNQPGNYHSALASGNYTIEITSPEGCLNDTTIFLLPPNELYLKVAQDSFSILLGESIQLEAIVNQTGVHFQWTPSVFLDNDTIFNPVAVPFKSIAYQIKGTDLRGCVKIDSVWVEVLIDRDVGIYIPNAFTPNIDGTNDNFYVRNSNPGVVGYEVFQIFDKYDEKVFDIRDLSGGDQAAPENPFFSWDGSFRGKKAEMGAYRYVIVLKYVDGEKKTATGTLQLIR